MRRIFRVIYYFFIVFIFFIAILLIVSVFPIPGNYKVMVVQSGSMEPTIKQGSVVVIKPTGNYKIGDIITFGPYNKTKPPTTHRIYDIKVIDGKPIYITKGDANNAPDQQEVTQKDILGKAIFKIPFIGYAVAFAKKPWGFAIIIIIPAILIITDEIRKILQEIKRTKQEKEKDPRNS